MANLLAKIPTMDPEAPPPLAAPPTMDGPPPDMGVTPAPMVTRIPTQGEQNIAHDQARLQKVQWAQEHPWGTPENHPGKLGKIAHVFSTLGNIAGNIVVPNVMANIPQTQLGMKAEEGQLAKRIGTEQSAESENQLRDAQTSKAQEEALLEPQKEADTHRLVDPNIAHINAETAALLHPQAKTDFEAWQLQNPGKPIQEWLDAKASEKTQTPTAEIQRQLIDAQNKGDTATAAKLTKQLKDLNPLGEQHISIAQQQLAEKIPMLVDDGKGGKMLQYVQPGQSLTGSFMSPNQAGGVNVAGEKDKIAGQKQIHQLDGSLEAMNEFSQQHTGASDFGIIMNFAGAVKPESVGKLRWQKAEQDYVEGLRSSFGDLEAWRNKIASGQRLTDQERNEMIRATEIVRNAKAAEVGAPEVRSHGGHLYEKGDDGQWHLHKNQ